jgi:dihydroflavonol-4-reductase
VSKFWVAGATGFLGSHLVRTLLERGHQVALVSKNGGSVHGVDVAALDVLDEAAVRESARGCDGAFLVTGRVSRDRDDAELLHRDNVLGTESALRGLRAAGLKRVVVASTSGTLAVSRDPERIADESCRSPLEIIARWPYYRTKLYAERAALEANRPGEFEVVIANPSLLLGPGDLRESSTGDVRLFLERSIPAIPAGGMAFVDARDAALGLLLAFERGRPGERYLLNAKNMTIAAFFQRLERISGVKAPLLRMPSSRPLAIGLNQVFTKAVEAIGGRAPVDAISVEMAQYFWYCSSEKAERELGFAPRDPGETIRDTVDDLVKRKVVAVSKGSHLGAFAAR